MPNDEPSYIIKRRDYSRLFYDPKPEVIADFLEQPLGFIAELVTGMLAEGPKQLAVFGGKIAQAALKGHLFEEFAREVQDFRKKGKIDENFGDTKYGYQSWVELLTIIDNECPDPDRLEALKAMFFSVNSVKSTDAQKILAYQLFQIAKELTSSQLLLMKACYELGKSGELANVDNIDRAHTGVGATREQWIQLVIKWLGHDVRALISRDDEILVRLRLLGEDSGFSVSSAKHGRLTDLGLRFCKNIENYVIEISGNTEK
ncbi:MAG: hypothetical protein WBQ76_02420 [Candidatus Korobacteraceae bacterium]